MSEPWPNTLGAYPKHHLSHLFAQSAKRLPDKPALISSEGPSFMYGQLWQATRKTASFLQREAGLKKGETVAVYAPNSAEWAVIFHGTLLCGAKVTTLNPLYKEREVEHQLDDADAVVVFAAAAMMPVVDAVRDKLSKVRQVYVVEDLFGLVEGESDTPAPVEIDPERDVAALPYSSGTTGLPKGVMLTHYNLTSNLKQMIGTDLVTEQSVLLAFLPFYHIYGMVVMLNATLAVGASCVVMPRFDPELTLQLIEQHKVTDFFVVPPALLALSHHPKLNEYDHSSLRFIMSGAAPLPQEVADLAAKRFGCTMMQGYGMTETSPLTNLNPLDTPKAGTVGPAVPDTQEKIVDMESGEEIAQGEVGELIVSGPQVMLGYWKNPDATKETIRPDGWLRTGDIASMDEDGYVTILDRAKEMIKYKGYQVAPAELESLVMEHPAVLDAAVIPKADFESGEVPKAFVVLKEGQQATAEDIMAFVAERVAPYKKLRELEFVASIPKVPSGKILRRELIAQERAKAKT
jgi:acyl-CoA synthetase (AMP-forming)/AMP-acid ligase II